MMSQRRRILTDRSACVASTGDALRPPGRANERVEMYSFSRVSVRATLDTFMHDHWLSNTLLFDMRSAIVCICLCIGRGRIHTRRTTKSFSDFGGYATRAGRTFFMRHLPMRRLFFIHRRSIFKYSCQIARPGLSFDRGHQCGSCDSIGDGIRWRSPPDCATFTYRS